MLRTCVHTHNIETVLLPRGCDGWIWGGVEWQGTVRVHGIRSTVATAMAVKWWLCLWLYLCFLSVQCDELISVVDGYSHRQTVCYSTALKH